MLVAMTKQQQLFQLSAKISRHELQQLKQHEQFFCPQCQEPLLLKAGQIKIPHFAHSKNSDCVTLFSEGESTEHLLGKQQLFQLFTKLRLNPVLEPYLPQLRQRPDLLVTGNMKQYAVEFQCSPLSSDLFRQRTDGYREAGITPIWLPHTPEKYKTSGIVKISVSHTHAQYMQHYQNQRFLLTYDVQSEMFYYVSNLLHLHNRQYFALIKKLPLYGQHFPFYVPEKIRIAPFQQVIIRFQQYRDRYLTPRLLLSKKGINDRFLRALYELKLSMNTLPVFLGIPVRFAGAFDVFCLEWQVQLFYFMKCHELTPATLNKKAIPHFFEWMQTGLTYDRQQAVEHYIDLLRQLQIRNVQDHIDLAQIIPLLYDRLVAIGG